MESNVYRIAEYVSKGCYVISITESKDYEFQGVAYFPTIEKILKFETVWELAKIIYQDITENHFPQNVFEIREWIKGQKKESIYKFKAANKEISAPLCSFLIQIKFCQSATMQGYIYWKEGGQVKAFRSLFEMLSLMEDVVQTKQKEKLA